MSAACKEIKVRAVHRVRHWRVTTCKPHCWMSSKIASLRYPFFAFIIISFNFSFLPFLFLSTILCHFILSILYSLLFISCFPSACDLLYFLCFLPLYSSFPVLRLSQFPQPQPIPCPCTVETSNPVSLFSCPTRTAQWTRLGQKNWRHSFMR